MNPEKAKGVLFPTMVIVFWKNLNWPFESLVMLYPGLQILFFSDSPKTTTHPLLMVENKQFLWKLDFMMQEFVDLCPVLWLEKEKKPFLSQKCFSNHYRITIMTLQFLFLLPGWKRWLSTMPAPGGYYSTNKGPAWHLWEGWVLLCKVIGAQPMDSRALQIKALSSLGLSAAGQRVASACETSGNAQVGAHICGQQRETRLWRWNIFPASLPSWPSIASAYYRVPPQVRGLLHQTPVSLSSKKDCDRPWTFRAILESGDLYSLTYPYFYPFNFFLASHLSLTFHRGWTALDVAVF